MSPTSSSPTRISAGTAISPRRPLEVGGQQLVVGVLARPAAGARTRVAASRRPAAATRDRRRRGLRCGPSTHIRRLASTASSMSPRSSAASSALAEALDRIRPLCPGSGAPTRTSARDQLRAGEREVERRQPAHRDADHRDRAEGERLDQPREVGGVGVGLGRDRRAPEAAQVAADRPVRARERPPLRLPHAAVADALVDEQHRRALAGDLVEELQPAGRLRRGRQRSRRGRQDRRHARGAGGRSRAAERSHGRA